MVKAFLSTGALQLLTMLVLLIRGKALALALGPQLVGVMAVVDRLVGVFAQTAALSLPLAAVRFLPPLWSADRPAFGALFCRMRNALLVMAAGASALGIGLALWAPRLLGEELAPYRPVLLAAFLTVPVIALVPFLQNAIAGQQQPTRSMLLAVLHAVILTVASVAGVAWNGLTGLYVLYAAAGLALALVAGARVAPAAAPAGFPVALPRQVWRFSLALLALAFTTAYAALFVHYRVLGVLGAESAGWMQAAVAIALSVRTLVGAAHRTVLAPRVNEGGTPAERMAQALRFQRTFCLLVAAGAPLLLLFPDLAVRALYSEAFLPGAAFVALFVLVEVITLLAGTYQALVVALDRIAFQVGQSLVAMLLLIAAAEVLVPRAGIVGAGVAALVAPLFQYAAATLFLNRAYGLRVPRRMLALTLFVVAALCAAGIVGVRHPGLGGEALAVKAVAYVVVLAGIGLFLDASERDTLRRTRDALSARRLARHHR